MLLRFSWLPILALTVCLLTASLATAQVQGDSVIHDPSRIIKDGDRYYVYYTPQNFLDGIWFKWSDNLATWHAPNGGSAANAIFDDAPPWVPVEKPNNDGTFWAPSILQHNGEYRMYYSVSTIFTQESAIGLATNSTLDYRDPNYQWVDQGMVIESEVGYPYNTIDPSVFVDADQRMWMVFGSYWQGIHITELNPASGKPYDPTPSGAKRIATRSVGTDIEAPYIHYRDGYYYLFANWGSCCSGVDSTYNIRVGRSTSPTGPYLDNAAYPVDMLAGGGTLFLGAEGDHIGPGHAGIFSEGGVDYFGYHYYDASSNGAPRYEIDTLLWDTEGWPLLLSQAMNADLNRNLVLDPGDWLRFAEFSHADIAGLPLSGRVTRGDLDRDGDNDFEDFRLFKRYYNAVNGAGALESVIAMGAPEPASAALAIMVAGSLICPRRRIGGFHASASPE